MVPLRDIFDTLSGFQTLSPRGSVDKLTDVVSSVASHEVCVEPLHFRETSAAHGVSLSSYLHQNVRA